MTKQSRRWFGRPNAPPLNWHTPDTPAIRQISAQDDDAEEDHTPFRWVRLSGADWIRLLQALYLYESKFGDALFQEWRLAVRGRILESVDPEDKDSHHTIEFTVKNWRTIWRILQKIATQYPKDWQPWFKRISQIMKKQITSQT